MRFFRHDEIYRSDVVIASGKLGPGYRLPLVGPGPSCRTRREDRALPIVLDEFRPAIPQQVGRHQGLSPLHRQDQNKTLDRENGIIYHQTVSSVLTQSLSPGAHFTMG